MNSQLANAHILDTKKFRSSLFKGSQGWGTESLMGFKGNALNILCSWAADFVRRLISYVSNISYNSEPS